jgi:PadR family transcriptional regulator PadR
MRCMEAEMLKGHLDTIMLAALEGGPAHGYAIIEEIRKRSDATFDLPEGTIYPALHRLEQAGFLGSTWTTPPGLTPKGGRKRRVYSLTPKGRDALAERRRVWGRFARAVDTMLGGRRAWPA